MYDAYDGGGGDGGDGGDGNCNDQDDEEVADHGRWPWKVMVNVNLLCAVSAWQGNTGRPGPSGPTGPPGQGFQGPKVWAKTCSYTLSSEI